MFTSYTDLITFLFTYGFFIGSLGAVISSLSAYLIGSALTTFNRISK